MDGIRDVIEKANVIREKRSQELAQELAPDAVKMLSKIMKGNELPGSQRATPAVMRQAAMDIVTLAHGRPETRDPRVGGSGNSGLTIVINQLTTGERPTEMVIDPVMEAVAIAGRIQSRREESNGVEED
jgi:hypothetical protein